MQNTLPLPDALPEVPAPPDQASPVKPPEEKRVSPSLSDARDFIAALAAMRDQVPGRPNRRGLLAQLKRNAGEKWPGRGVAWFTGLLYEGDTGRRLANTDVYFLVATLFDLNRLTTERGASNFGNLGASFRRAVNAGANEEGVKRRFQILLDATWDEKGDGELAFRLRQSVQWLAGQKVGLDWAQLLTDLCFWEDPKRSVQKRWARAFFEAPRVVRDDSNS